MFVIFSQYLCYDISEIKNATTLWSVVHCDKYPSCRTNDNVFIFNQMLGYNTVLFGGFDKKWQWGRVNELSATCYINYSANYYTCIQPMANRNEIAFNFHKKDEIIIHTVNMNSSLELLDGIV